MKNPVVRNVLKYLAIIAGAAVYAMGFQFFHYPNDIVAGGVVGIAMILNRLIHTPVGLMTIIINVPLFIIAWRHFGIGFMLASFAGMGISSVFVDLLALTGYVATLDPMLGAIIGGVIKGAGLGIVYYVGATTGGIDIVIKLMRQKWPHLNFGTMMLILDVCIITVYALIFGRLDSAMYSVIAMFVVSKVIDLILYGIDNSCICYIISDKPADISGEITGGHMHRGVTLLEGQGAYSHQHKQVIMCVIKRVQIAELKRIVRSIDERAFVIVTDAKNVFGNGFERITEVK